MSHKNIKRVVAQKMFTHQTSNGKVKSMVNIISATRKNNNTQIVRHLRENNNRSTIIAKSKGNKFNIIEKQGDTEPVKLSNQSVSNLKKILKNQKNRMIPDNETQQSTKKEKLNNQVKNKKRKTSNNLNNLNNLKQRIQRNLKKV